MAKDKKGKKDGKKKGGKKKGGGGLQRRAARLTSGVIRRGINDIRKERRQIRRETRSQVGDANRDYKRAKGDLKHLYGESQEFLRGVNQKNRQTYQGARDMTQNAQQALGAALGGTYGQAQQDITNELGRLGISGGGNMSGLLSDRANAEGVAAQSGQNALSTLSQSNVNTQQLGQLLRGMSRGQYQSNRGQALNARNDAVAAARQSKLDGYNKVREAMSDLRGTRRDIMLQFLEQLNSQRAANMQARAAMIQARKMKNYNT